MAAHIIRIAGAVAFVLACILQPSLPGRYDPLAIPLSMVAQVFSKAALLFVPVGLIWLAAERLDRARHAMRVIAIGAFAVIAVLTSLVAMYESVLLGLIALAISAYITMWLRRQQTSAIPLYFVIVPALVALIEFAVVARVADYSRNRAIDHSAPLIAEIEAHRAAHGRYPRAIVAVHPDVWPEVIGIKEYRYEPSEHGYNLSFENPTFQLGMREFVVYNPRGEQVMTSHTLDVLQLTPEQLALDRTRGHNAVTDAKRPHWKSFWYD